MKLVLVRHAIAEDRELFAKSGAPDDERPLTKDGRKKMVRAAHGLRELVDEPDMIVSSPLLRAVQTAEIIADEYNATPPVQSRFLAPGSDFESFLAWLLQPDAMRAVIAVGHEPHLSGLAAWLITGNQQPLFELKKGSGVLLEFEGEVRMGAARIRWFLTPAQLRFIGDHN